MTDEAQSILTAAIEEELALGGDPKSIASAAREALRDECFVVVKLPDPEDIPLLLDTIAGLRYFSGTERGYQMGAALLAPNQNQPPFDSDTQEFYAEFPLKNWNDSPD